MRSVPWRSRGPRRIRAAQPPLVRLAVLFAALPVGGILAAATGTLYALPGVVGAVLVCLVALRVRVQLPSPRWKRSSARNTQER